MQSIKLEVCQSVYHERLKASPREWGRLSLVGYSESENDGEYMEHRNCRCGSSLVVRFRPSLPKLASIRQLDLSPVPLAAMMIGGDREAGIEFCRRFPANRRWL